MSLAVPVCRSCGAAAFPPRALCPRCGGSDWTEGVCEEGVLEAATECEGVIVGEVRTPLGPVVIARVVGDAAVGASVALADEGGVPVARG